MAGIQLWGDSEQIEPGLQIKTMIYAWLLISLKMQNTALVSNKTGVCTLNDSPNQLLKFVFNPAQICKLNCQKLRCIHNVWM